MSERLNLAGGRGGFVPEPVRGAPAPVQPETGVESLALSSGEDRVRPPSVASVAWLDGGMAVLDAEGCILQINEALACWFGGRADRLVGQFFWELLKVRCGGTAIDLEPVRTGTEPFRELALRLPRDGGGIESLKLEIAACAGAVFVRMGSVLPKLAELRLSSAAWKETLSILTMGLAHDFGNVMAGIHALAESFLEQVGEQHEFADGLNLVKQNSRQASQLVHRIINLHQGQTGERDYHNLNELASDVADLVRKIIPRRMQLEVRLFPRALPAYVDAVELRQVVINLVLNAVDAMSPDGVLILQTEAFTELPRTAHHCGTLPRLPAVGLSVRDDGSGIAGDHLPRIFEPFFSTKPSNEGAGVGLYNARVFAERHRGAIAVETAVPGGTRFLLLLPEADFAEAREGRPDAGGGAAASVSGVRAPAAPPVISS